MSAPTGGGPRSSLETNQRFTCCRHCVPQHPAHPAGRDEHPKACGPWCSESVEVRGRQETLFTIDSVVIAVSRHIDIDEPPEDDD